MTDRWQQPQRLVRVLGGRWTLAVLAELANGGRRYQDIHDALYGISYAIRSARYCFAACLIVMGFVVLALAPKAFEPTTKAIQITMRKRRTLTRFPFPFQASVTGF